MENKTFTQEELNTIVQDRLAKEKAKYEKQIADIQRDVVLREKKLQAKEKLSEKGLPAELIDLVRLDNDEAFDTSLELLEKTYKQQNKAQTGTKIQTAYIPNGNDLVREDPIRSAMGLKK